MCIRDSTDLSHAALNACTLRDLRFDRTDLTGASLVRTALNGLDLTSCELAGLCFSEELTELRGVTVRREQAAELAKLLGLTIVD